MFCQVLKRGGCGEFLIDRHNLSVDQMTDPLYNIAPNNTMYTDTFIKRVDLMLSIISTIIIKEQMLGSILLLSSTLDNNFMESYLFQSNCLDNCLWKPLPALKHALWSLPFLRVALVVVWVLWCLNELIVAEFLWLSENSTKSQFIMLQLSLPSSAPSLLRLSQNSIWLCSFLLLSHSEVYFSFWLLTLDSINFSFNWFAHVYSK